MGKDFRKLWILLLTALIPSIISIAIYAINFYDKPISKNPEDWSYFATYISGTVGVAAVFATLIALIYTLHQQRTLLSQQDSIIDQQNLQIEMSKNHQDRIEAYTKVEKFFRPLLESCLSDLNKYSDKILRDRQYQACNSENFPKKQRIAWLIFNTELKEPEGGIVYEPFIDNFWREILSKPYQLAKMASQCIDASEELRPYIKNEIGDYILTIKCSLAYAESIDKEESRRIAKSLEIPIHPCDNNMSVNVWRNIGEVQHG